MRYGNRSHFMGEKVFVQGLQIIFFQSLAHYPKKSPLIPDKSPLIPKVLQRRTKA